MKITQRLLLVIWLCSVFLWISQAWYMSNILWNMNMVAINDILWTPKIFDMQDKSYKITKHGSADEENKIILNSTILEHLVLIEKDYQTFQKTVRQHIIKKMIQQWFSGFVARPLQTANNIITFSTGDLSFEMHKIFNKQDDLDILLKDKLAYYKKYFEEYKKFSAFAEFPELEFSKDELLAMQNIFLFKDDADLQSLWYEIVSYRSRINNDKEYRRHNISTAFANMWNLVILNPGRTYELMPELHYSSFVNDGKKAFMQWYAILGGVEKLVYAGWLCGVASSVNQWILTNLWLDILEKKAHSIWYKSLYTANINWKLVDMPWLDATVYKNKIDLVFKNIRNYPIILIMNYNGSKWWLEQVFTLAPIENKWSFEYIGYSKKWWQKCYSRDINWEIMRNCYNKIVH